MCRRRFDMGERLWLLRRRYSELRDRLLERRRREREREREWCLRELRWDRDLQTKKINKSQVRKPKSHTIILLCTLNQKPDLPGFRSWPRSRSGLRFGSGMMGTTSGARWWAASGFRWASRGCAPRAGPRVLNKPDCRCQKHSKAKCTKTTTLQGLEVTPLTTFNALFRRS